MEVSHHISATLYFGISALEAFLNQRMRLHLRGAAEDKILEVLRKATVATKIKKWPRQILTSPVILRPDTLEKLFFYNDVRGNLTHPKYLDHRDYEQLRELDPKQVVEAVAEYIAQFLLAAGEPFRYWLWGWNYLAPGRDGYQIALLPETQIVWSLRSLGFQRSQGSWPTNEAWRNTHMKGYAAYSEVTAFLEGLDYCEPKHKEFPYQPKLCRRWWDPKHQATCGMVTPEAINFAVNYNPVEEARIEAEIARRRSIGRFKRVVELLRYLFVRR
jgi:hypothetical protein